MNVRLHPALLKRLVVTTHRTLFIEISAFGSKRTVPMYIFKSIHTVYVYIGL
ncbi:hypothetical protein SAMN05192533_101516 [Mesobacillus persicus]|uniref:Uncharacterized protein n=1 Tax=Mesobacillus persicus TaxID=930146 RepID=A0A1H7WP48_9BACI|nr:hypothetical protein SAMN05192533_101516 [Mesobacillus persicus]